MASDDLGTIADAAQEIASQSQEEKTQEGPTSAGSFGQKADALPGEVLEEVFKTLVTTMITAITSAVKKDITEGAERGVKYSHTQARERTMAFVAESAEYGINRSAGELRAFHQRQTHIANLTEIGTREVAGMTSISWGLDAGMQATTKNLIRLLKSDDAAERNKAIFFNNETQGR